MFLGFKEGGLSPFALCEAWPELCGCRVAVICIVAVLIIQLYQGQV